MLWSRPAPPSRAYPSRSLGIPSSSTSSSSSDVGSNGKSHSPVVRQSRGPDRLSSSNLTHLSSIPRCGAPQVQPPIGLSTWSFIIPPDRDSSNAAGPLLKCFVEVCSRPSPVVRDVSWYPFCFLSQIKISCQSWRRNCKVQDLPKKRSTRGAQAPGHCRFTVATISRSHCLTYVHSLPPRSKNTAESFV